MTAESVDDKVASAIALVKGKVLVRTHGTYHLMSAGSIDESTLSGGAYVVRDVTVLPLTALASTIAKMRSEGLAEGLFLSSTEVISHLKAGGVQQMQVKRGSRRWAIVTTVMVTAKENPVRDPYLFFFGEAFGPRMRAAVTEHPTSQMVDENDAAQQPRSQPPAE